MHVRRTGILQESVAVDNVTAFVLLSWIVTGYVLALVVGDLVARLVDTEAMTDGGWYRSKYYVCQFCGGIVEQEHPYCMKCHEKKRSQSAK